MRIKWDHPVLLAALGAAGFLLTEFVRTAPATVRNGPGPDPRSPSGSGRGTGKPTEIPPAGWWAILKRVAGQVSADRPMTEAAGVTFFSLLAIFPAMAALISLYGLFADPRTVSTCST